MASAHDIIFVQDLSTGDTSGILFNENDGTPVNSIIDGAVGVTKAVLLSPKSIDHIFAAVCSGCTVEVVSLQMSPDGVNWCDCVLSDGNNCEVSCDPAVQNCYTKNVDVAVLQYVRLKIGNASTSSGNCTVKLHFTLN